MIDIILVVFIIITLVTDLKYRKIFNFITLPAIILGLGVNTISGGFAGFMHSFLGMAAGFCFLIVIYLLGGVGAGDVKYMAVVGSLKGVKFLVLGGLYGAIAAGAYAVIMLAIRKRLFYTLNKVVIALVCFISSKKKESLEFDPGDSLKLPYSVFLSIGMIIRLIAN